MKNWFQNKTIAVVGNAKSLFSKNYGTIIDNHTVVCRINRGFEVQSPKSHGVKLDILCFARYNTIKDHITQNFKTEIKKYIHCGAKGYDDVNNHDITNITYIPKSNYWDLKKKLNLKKKQKPSSGLILLDYISTCNPAQVSLFGFDWKKTPTFYDQLRTDEPHLYDIEKQYVYECFIKNLKYELHS